MDWAECCAILAIDADHTPEELRAAYKALALKSHPDKNRDDGAATRLFQVASPSLSPSPTHAPTPARQELQHAYSFLTDPAKRRAYHEAHAEHGVLYDSEDDDFFYDEEVHNVAHFAFSRLVHGRVQVMSFFFGLGPTGRAASGACDCFYCRERKQFREGAAGGWSNNRKQRSFCARQRLASAHATGAGSAACGRGAAARAPCTGAAKCVRRYGRGVGGGARVALTLGRTRRTACPRTAQRWSASAPSRLCRPRWPLRPTRARRKSARAPRRSAPRTTRPATVTVRRTMRGCGGARRSSACSGPRRRSVRAARWVGRLRALVGLTALQAERSEREARTQMENVARQLAAELAADGTERYDAILACVVAHGGKGKAARRALLQQREAAKREREVREEAERRQQFESACAEWAHRFPDLERQQVVAVLTEELEAVAGGTGGVAGVMMAAHSLCVWRCC